MTISGKPTGGVARGGPLHDWPRLALRQLSGGHPVARAVVARTRGSTPREAGACILVAEDWTCGTIGGGRLEWEAIGMARALLHDPHAPPARVCKLVLGTELAQCCGGVVELWIERYGMADLSLLREAADALCNPHALLVSTLLHGQVERRILISASPEPVAQLVPAGETQIALRERLGASPDTIWIYGAGHVGGALVRILEHLPMQVTWIDSRAELLATAAASVNAVHAAEPLTTVAEAPPGTSFLIMTHSHALDYALCRAVLARADFAWVGVIGSRSKAARFRTRLAREGLPADNIARLVCPIGITGIDSKLPAAIAVAVAAQLLQATQSGTSRVPEDEVHCDPQLQCATCGLRSREH